MSALTPGTVLPLSAATKTAWELGDERVIAAGSLDADGALAPGDDWRLSVASIETPGTVTTPAGFERELTLHLGELVSVTIDGTEQGVEPMRPLKIAADASVTAALPTGDVLTVNLLTRAGAVRGNVRIVEISPKRDMHLFRAQFGVLLQGRATVEFDGTTTTLEVRDTVVGGDDQTPTISGRGYLLVASLDLP